MKPLSPAQSIHRALLALLICGVAAPGQTATDASLRREGAAYEAVCGACHPTSMADGLRSELDWRETIEVMQGLGAKGTTEQFEQLLRFLLRTQTRVNVNTATASEIAPVLDISTAAAEALVKHRVEKGNFKALDDLKKVPGIAAAKLDARKDRIVF